MFLKKFWLSGSPHSFIHQTIAERAPATYDIILVCRIQSNSRTGLVSDQARNLGGGFQIALPSAPQHPWPVLGQHMRLCRLSMAHSTGLGMLG